MGKKKAHVSLASANSRPFCTKCSVITFHAHDDRSAINQRVDEREAVMENMCSFPINYAAAATGRLRALLYRTKCARARATTGHQKSINIQDVPARRKRKVKEKNFHLLHVAQLWFLTFLEGRCNRRGWQPLKSRNIGFYLVGTSPKTSEEERRAAPYV